MSWGLIEEMVLFARIKRGFRGLFLALVSPSAAYYVWLGGSRSNFIVRSRRLILGNPACLFF
jgi:hypothetical protein